MANKVSPAPLSPCPFCGKIPTVRGDRVQCDDHTYALSISEWRRLDADRRYALEEGRKAAGVKV